LHALHTIYELLIASTAPLPGLPPRRELSERTPPDVVVHLKDGHAREIQLSGPSPSKCLYTGTFLNAQARPTLQVVQFEKDRSFGFFYADGTRFLISSDGRQIWADWPASYTLEDACTYLVGPVLAFTLRQRGATCLHASAIEVDGMAIALVGAPGAGKSTTAAAFALAGFPVVSDDIVVLSETGGRLFVQPGYPRVNVWPDSARALMGCEDTLPHITPTWGKKFLALDQNGLRFASRALPLGAVYLLAERQAQLAAPTVEAISGSEAMVTLAANTYQNYLLDAEMRRKDFELFERLAKTIPVRRVLRPDDISSLAASCQVIATDARQLLTLRSAGPASSADQNAQL
jgi:hypothetical protein